MPASFKYIYGPVPSWRLGRSLGVDLLSQPGKICSFDCVYCQLGRTDSCPAQRRAYVPDDGPAREIAALPETAIDYVTFSGRGEATLASNLPSALEAARRARNTPAALITNSVLLADTQVRSEVSAFDFVLAKLDACDDAMLADINRPQCGVKLSDLVDGLCAFRELYRGRLAVQTMFVERNAACADAFAELYRRIRPEEVQVNTPLRPCAAQPLARARLAAISARLAELLPEADVKNVYETAKPQVSPLSEPQTLRRRGKS